VEGRQDQSDCQECRRARTDSHFLLTKKYLYANGVRLVRKYKVLPDDTVDVANMEVIMDKTKDPLPGITDGMKVDAKGKYMGIVLRRNCDTYA